MSHLIAITTRDGKVVQEHFGHARHFHIVRVDDDGTWTYVETREATPGCGGEPDCGADPGGALNGDNPNGDIEPGRGGDIEPDDPHSARFAPIVRLLTDCEAVVTAQIGPGAAEYVITHGLRVFEGRGFVSDILEEIISNHLLEQT